MFHDHVINPVQLYLYMFLLVLTSVQGHEDLKTTMRYAHPEDSLKDAVELLTKTTFSDSLTDKSTDIGN